ncbi:MAG: hypothetical protein NVS4B11_07700 [Ktedonobacteraceae bacterium]
MECSNPGAIRDEELFAHLEGESVRPAVLRHLANCQYCSSQVATYRRIELKLINKLYRWDCPPNQVLGDYQFGLLSPQQSVEVGNHLSMCVLCKAEVATLTEFLTHDPMLVPQIQVSAHTAVNAVRPVQEAQRALENMRNTSLAGARRIIATLLQQQPRKAYQRDAVQQTAAWPRRYSAEDVNVSIQIERDAHHRDMLQVIGFVARKSTTLEALDGTPVKLIAQTRTAITEYAEPIDDLGNFVFPTVAEGIYTLEIHFSEGIVVIDQLPIEIQ